MGIIIFILLLSIFFVLKPKPEKQDLVNTETSEVIENEENSELNTKEFKDPELEKLRQEILNIKTEQKELTPEEEQKIDKILQEDETYSELFTGGNLVIPDEAYLDLALYRQLVWEHYLTHREEYDRENQRRIDHNNAERQKAIEEATQKQKESGTYKEPAYLQDGSPNPNYGKD